MRKEMKLGNINQMVDSLCGVSLVLVEILKMHVLGSEVEANQEFIPKWQITWTGSGRCSGSITLIPMHNNF